MVKPMSLYEGRIRPLVCGVSDYLDSYERQLNKKIKTFHLLDIVWRTRTQSCEHCVGFTLMLWGGGRGL
jgi:hypothetical protein